MQETAERPSCMRACMHACMSLRHGLCRRATPGSLPPVRMAPHATEVLLLHDSASPPSPTLPWCTNALPPPFPSGPRMMTAASATPGAPRYKSQLKMRFIDRDEHVYFWFPLLAGLSELTFDPRQVRCPPGGRAGGQAGRPAPTATSTSAPPPPQSHTHPARAPTAGMLSPGRCPLAPRRPRGLAPLRKQASARSDVPRTRASCLHRPSGVSPGA